MKIGFLGLGQMGQAMAANLVKADHEVSVYNRSPGKDEALLALGARRAETPAQAATGGAVVSMLADDKAVEAVAFGAQGIMSALPAGGLHISCSTISVALCERLTQAHANAGQRFAAAPVFGRPDAAAAGKLFIAAAGEAGALTDAQPVFEAIGQRVFVLGAHPPAAYLVKLRA